MASSVNSILHRSLWSTIAFLATNLPVTASELRLHHRAVSLRVDQFTTLRSGHLRTDTTDAPVSLEKCEVTTHHDHRSDEYSKCPADCPYLAEDETSEGFCNFKCVADAAACQALNPRATVADEEVGACMPCAIPGCRDCATDGTQTCTRCNAGYYLTQSGGCGTGMAIVWWISGTVALLISIFTMVWLIDLLMRDNINKDGLRHGLEYRSRQKCHMALNHPEANRLEPLWPLDTNLHREDVAGPGVMLFFNFQGAIIVWAIVIACVWCILALTVDPELFSLGVTEPMSPRMYCVLTARGHRSQERLKWAIELFKGIMYLISFFGSLALGVYQLRRFQEYDNDVSSMKDYVAEVHGMPIQTGDQHVEENMKDYVMAKTGKNVVGVSIGWDYQSCKKEVEDALEQQMAVDQATFGHLSSIRTPSQKASAEEKQGALRCFFIRLERWLLGYPGDQTEPAPIKPSPRRADMEMMLKGMKTTDFAFVVFETEADRDEAVSQLRGQLEFDVDGAVNKCTFVKGDCEPDTVMWNNLGHSRSKVARIVLGFTELSLALMVWTICFYAPYAYFVLAADYTHWTKPSDVQIATLSMVVVAGNAFMYLVCSHIADGCRFIYSDSKEAAHVALYTVAVIVNVAIDLGITYRMASRMMSHRGIHTHDGRAFSEVESFSERLTSYAMQRALGNELWMYNFPATFLTPFVIEPIVTLLVPLVLMQLVVRSHPEVKGIDAEKCLECWPMDLTRYGDVLINVTLTALTLFFPSGFFFRTFLALVVCNTFIYAYDHWRALRAVPQFDYSEIFVERCGQLLLSIPCGIMLTAIAFRSEPLQELLKMDLDRKVAIKIWHKEDHELGFVEALLGIFALHVVVHCLLVIYVVPFIAKKLTEHSVSPKNHAEVARFCACTFFTSNPVWHLRSKFFYNHEPPCGFYIPGKEYTLKTNPTAHCYFNVSIDDIGIETYDINQIGLDMRRNLHQFHADSISPNLIIWKNRVKRTGGILSGLHSSVSLRLGLSRSNIGSSSARADAGTSAKDLEVEEGR